MRVTKLSVLICCLVFCGCGVVEFFTPEGPPTAKQIFRSYYQTKLKTSSASDVLAEIHLPEYELLSQSKSVIASTGQKKKGYKTWFTMVAFDENELSAKRKYLFEVDEKPKVPYFEWRPGLRFECAEVLESEVLDKPYSNENARRIAILRQVLENFRNDISELGQDNKALDISGAMVNQTFEPVLVKLDNSPALATKLSEPDGVDFDHISMGKGKIGLTVKEDIATVKVLIGPFVKRFKEKQ